MSIAGSSGIKAPILAEPRDVFNCYVCRNISVLTEKYSKLSRVASSGEHAPSISKGEHLNCQEECKIVAKTAKTNDRQELSAQSERWEMKD